MRGVDPFFAAVENSALSMWIVGSPSIWSFPFILVLHTVGLAVAVGASVAWDLRLLGLGGASVPLESLSRYFLVMWLGFWVNAGSGVLLLIAYPTKALTNPLFYVKLALIAVALVLATRLRRLMGAAPAIEVPAGARAMAVASLLCWAGAIFAGRFLAYTCTRLLVDTQC